MKLVCLVLFGALLAGCASGPRIDTRYSAVGQNSRVQYIILHYTSTDLAHSLQLLSEGEVSSHYLIGEAPATIYRLVDEDRRAWHAGDSQWQGRTWLNGTSIGIELVNQGFYEGAGSRYWQPYSPAQIDALIVLLKDIVQRATNCPSAAFSPIAISRRSARSTPARGSPGSAWRTPAWCLGRTTGRWRNNRLCSPKACRPSPGSRRNCPARVIRCRSMASWTRRHATYWRPFR